MRFPADTVLGWILVHAEEKYKQPPSKWPTPMAELGDLYCPGLRWHWNGDPPMKERGRPHHVLLAWKGEVFGHAIVTVTREVETGMDDYDFAFVLWAFKRTKRVPFEKLRLGKRVEDHRSLIKLDESIIHAFNRRVR